MHPSLYATQCALITHIEVYTPPPKKQKKQKNKKQNKKTTKNKKNTPQKQQQHNFSECVFTKGIKG